MLPWVDGERMALWGWSYGGELRHYPRPIRLLLSLLLSLLPKPLLLPFSSPSSPHVCLAGYVTARAASDDTANIFSAFVSVAPVTDWRDYDSIYTERYVARRILLEVVMMTMIDGELASTCSLDDSEIQLHGRVNGCHAAVLHQRQPAHARTKRRSENAAVLSARPER